jgi:toxin ParE1/3/4
MKLRYSPRALGDLAAISNYLIERSPAGAHSVEQAIRKTLSLLEQIPLGGLALQQRPEVRVIPTPRYPFLIFYTAGTEELHILHIRHAARAPLAIDEL